MKRTGKIARLPHHLRNQLNLRLHNGESGVDLIKWLNTLPEVQAILAEHFNGIPISPQNLSEWNNGGFLDWLTTQELLEDAREFAANTAELPGYTDGELANALSHAITARYAVLLGKMPLEGAINPDLLARFNLLHRLDRHVARIQRRTDRARKERPAAPVVAATPPSQKSGCDATSQKVPATPPSPHPSASPKPAILPALATPPRPKTSPALAGFYEKP